MLAFTDIRELLTHYIRHTIIIFENVRATSFVLDHIRLTIPLPVIERFPDYLLTNARCDSMADLLKTVIPDRRYRIDVLLVPKRSS
jgi:hypothetical protein